MFCAEVGGSGLKNDVIGLPPPQTNISKLERLPFFDSLRAAAIIMVVAVHALGYCHHLPDNQREIIFLIVHTVSVPVFFLVDGYLLARGIIFAGTYNYWGSIRKNIFRLLIPWIVFTLIYTMARYYFEATGVLKEMLIVGHTWQDVAISAYGSVYAPQMYFLFSLFLIRLCGPFFKIIILIKNTLGAFYLLFCLFAVSQICTPYVSSHLEIDRGLEPITHALWGLQYYVAGIVLFKISNFIELNKLLVPNLFIFLFFLPIFEEMGKIGYYIIQYSYLIAIFLFFKILGNRSSFLSKIGRNTMGIYLVHAPVVLKSVSIIVNKFISIPLLDFFAVLLVTFSVTGCIVAVVNKIPYMSLIFGIPYKK